MNNKIGSLWQRLTKQNVPYLSGVITLPTTNTALRIVVFANRHKQKPNQPDYEIFLSQPRDQEEQAVQIEQANGIAREDENVIDVNSMF